MSFLPGWDSAETTAAIAHNLHITAIVVLGLLFVSEGMALIYDSRKEHLVGVANTSAETKRQAEADAAEARRKAEVEGLQKQLTEADKKVAELQQFQAQRRLTAEQKRAIVAAISPFKGQQVAVGSLFGDDDGKRYRDDFAEVISQSGWALEGRVGEMMIDAPQDGVAVALDKGWITAGNSPPKAAEALIAVLHDMRIMDGLNITLMGNLPPGRIVLIVGAKSRK